MAQTRETPFVRDVIIKTGEQKPVLLTPIVQSGTVDVSDIAHLKTVALREVLVERASVLIPLLEANALATESGRRVVDENIAAIREAGLFKIMVPKRFGGLETDLRTMLEISRELGKGCGSTSWATTLMNGCAYMAGLSSAECQQEIWGSNGEARIAGVFAPLAVTKRVDGGLIVKGKWPWSSGCLHADWAMVGVPVVNAAGEVVDQALAFIPMRECTIEDSWYVVGMKGTGSNTIVVDEVFVPEHRLMSISKVMAGNPPTPHRDEILYRCAFIPVAALILVGPQLGLCSRALEFVIEKAPKRSVSYTFYKTQTESPSFQLAMAKASMLVDTAHLHGYRCAEVIYEAASTGRLMSYTERAKARMDVGYSIETARHAIDILLSAHGASSFAESSPLQRIWRDSETASRHAVANPEICAEVYGRALLGFTEGVTALV
jgi:3-hydroxy-9,10-secoandrosta-1,3,5(10)-triene-9,17-dione monooxygenase